MMTGQQDRITRLLEAAAFQPLHSSPSSAWIGHTPFAAWLVREFQPRRFVELGTHAGTSFFAVCQAVKAYQLETRCFAVDTWTGDEHAGFYDESVYSEVVQHQARHYSDCAHLLRMTFDQALNEFADGSVDLLHIDGLHTYEAVAHDFSHWLPKLAPGAIVLFHDTQVRERNFGVWRLWKELSERYPAHLEFQHSYGLGVLQLPGGAVAQQMPWIGQHDIDQRALIAYFAVLGQAQVTDLQYQQALEQAQLTDLRHQQTLESQVQTLQSFARALSEMQQSTSWRATQPLRWLGRHLKR